MKKLALILTIILTLCFSLLTTCSLAEETNALEVLLTTDKAEYTGGETIVATLTVTNNYAVDIALIQMENLVPENCELAVASKATATVENLESGETAELVTRFVTPAAVALPHTGDAAHPMVWAMLAAAALAGMIWLFVCRRKAFFCLFAVLMVSALLTSGGLVLAHADVQSNVTTVSTTVMVDGMPLVLHAEVIEGAGKNIYKAPDPEHIRDSVESIGQYVDNQLLLVAEEEVTQEQIEALIASHNGTVVGCLYLTDDFQIEFPVAYTEAQLEEIAAEWMESGLLIRADINVVYEWAGDSDPSFEMNDPQNTEWALEAIQAEGAWRYHDQFDYPIIGIIDGDFDIDHEDLGLITVLKNAGKTHSKLTNHGTHVLGILAANANNGKGITGMALDSTVAAYPIKNDCSDIAEWKYALTNFITFGCRVINVSMSGRAIDAEQLSDSTYYNQVLSASEEDGRIFDQFFNVMVEEGFGDFLIVTTAGNKGANTLLNGLFVSCEDNADRIIVVGNAWRVITDYRLFGTSNYGPRVDVVAPGTAINSTIPGGYKTETGTSMASPFVAGTAALCYAIDPNLTAPEVKDIIVDTADPIVTDTNDNLFDPYLDRNEGTNRTYKMLNAKAAVEMAGGIEPDEEEETDDPYPDTVFTVTGRIIDPNTGKPLAKLDGSNMLCFFTSSDSATHILNPEAENPFMRWASLEECRDINQLAYIRKNGDWYVTEIDPLENNRIALGDLTLNKFDSTAPYISSKKLRNADGTITCTVEAVGLGSVQFGASAWGDEAGNQVLSTDNDADRFELTNTSITFTFAESEVRSINVSVYAPYENSTSSNLICHFAEDIRYCGLGEIRFNTDIPLNWKMFHFSINNPISENYSN